MVCPDIPEMHWLSKLGHLSLESIKKPGFVVNCPIPLKNQRFSLINAFSTILAVWTVSGQVFLMPNN